MSKSKQKGTLFESLVATYLDRTFYPGARRNPLAGKNDVGDISLPGERRFILELKNCAKQSMPEWIKEAKREAATFVGDLADPAVGAVGVVVHKRHGNNKPAEQWVTMELEDFMKLMSS